MTVNTIMFMNGFRMPREAEDRLFVKDCDVSQNQEIEQVTIIYQLPPIEQVPTMLRLDNHNRFPG